ncbi:MAG: hypothetical protein AAGK74_20705, partial [Chloroflexota bacterium]
MTTIVAQIAPQRSTQYTELVTDLAPYELLLSNIGDRMTGELAFTRLGTQTYLKFELDEAPDEAALRSLGNMAMTDAYFQYYDSVGNEVGPFLKPIDVDT